MSFELVKNYLTERGYGDRAREFTVSSATVELAAAALGCEGARIAKTLSFKTPEGVVLIVAAGDAKVDNHKYKEKFHTKARMLTPEEAGGDLTYERKEDIDLGKARARRWRYTDAGSRWDFLAAEAGGFFFSIMVAVPEESAEALEEEVEALISSLSLDAEDTDDAPMLGADTSGFTLVMDTLAGDADGMGRATAYVSLDGGVSVTFQRGAADAYPFDSAEHLREAFAGEDAERLEDVEISGHSAERWRFALTLADESESPAEAVLLPGEDWAYAAVIGLTGGQTAENEAAVGRLLDQLTLS